ncbi:SGNH/GDSL hydrolase family protein [Streptomyces sp. NPDC048603]|uniref:SGNH/GDSL hydrolase family protein n=1 Tax=Streptomyces sp. NPDC048603 TaxID=3365577 RepID=UPI003717A52A
MPARRSTLACAVAVATALPVAALPASSAAATESGTSAAAVSGPYVALGDSYASAAGVPGQSAGLCLRSDRNYPSVLARQAGFTGVRDVTCAAAKTKHMTEAQIYPVIGTVNAPQLNAVTADTRLVTLTIGGNDLGASDLGVAEVILKCVSLSFVSPLGAPCKRSYGTTLDGRIASAGSGVASTVREIRRRAPQAKIMVVGYPAVLPENEWDCLFKQPITVYDAAFLRTTVKRLNRTLARQAEANGATFVDTYTPTIGHDICQDPEDRWIEGILPRDPAVPIHPNARGERAMAEATLAALR